jgi:transcriptional regulator GlxA family with amidase domain
VLIHDATGADKAPFDELVSWMAEHLNDDLSVDVLAARVAMSPRNFARRFNLAVKIAPGRYVQMLRLDAARRLLTESTLPVKQIADHCGFRSVETMRIAFQRSLNTSPSDFRDRFQSVKYSSP